MKKMMILLLAMLVLVLAGCGRSNQSGAVSKPDNIPQAAKSDEVVVDVYLDGTQSMYGYVNYSQGTIFSDAVKNIERTVTGTWKKETIHFIKFGDNFKELNRNEFLQMDQPSFYSEMDTSLQQVINKTNAKHLNVLVTDLFQTNQDLDSLVIALKNKYLTKDQAVAIIGMKSQFNGKVFDVGKNAASFMYATNDKTESYRPFYLMVFGKDADVRAFTTAYQNQMGNKGMGKAVLISANLGLDNHVANVQPTGKKEKGVSKLATISTLLPDNQFPQYRLKLGEKVSASNLELTSKDIIGDVPTTYTLVVDKVQTMKTVAQGGEQPKKGFFEKLFGSKNKGGDKQLEDVKATDFVVGELQQGVLNKGVFTLPFAIKVSPEAIGKQPGVYVVSYSLVPTQDNYISSMNVFKDWNVSDDNIGANLQAVGNKTLNISAFVELLATTNYQLNQPGFHNNYIYFDAIK